MPGYWVDIMISVDVRSVTRLWGETRAVDDVSFTIAKGDLAVLLGPSGCGKSTLLRMIAGLDRPSSGTIEIGGHDVDGLTGSARGVAMVFQSYALFPHLTVADNIIFGLSVRGIARPSMARRLERVAALLGLDALLRRKPAQLSGGQQQRVALGRAIIAEAPVCLMDEPLSNLDAQLRQEMRREIRSAAAAARHDHDLCHARPDRGHEHGRPVILMRGGRIEQNGAAGRTLRATRRPCSRPASSARAPMNFIDLEDGPDGAVVADSAGPASSRAAGRVVSSGCGPKT